MACKLPGVIFGDSGTTTTRRGTPLAPASARWLRDARTARALSLATLAWLGVESALGIGAGLAAHSVALIGWGMFSLVEAVASLIVVWRFTGSRTCSADAEVRAGRAVAISFWMLAPYLALHVLYDLWAGHAARPSVFGAVVTAVSLVVMPFLGVAKRRLGARLGSAATSGEGTQNLLCASQAAGVLAGIALNGLGFRWADPVMATLLAAVAVHEGRKAWRGHVCHH